MKYRNGKRGCRSAVAVLTIIIFVGLTGCTKKSPTPSAPAQRAELTISVAASMADVMNQMGIFFERLNPQWDYVINIGASDALAAQIEQGAPVDLFICADPRIMDRLEAKKLIDVSTRINVAGNQLDFVVPRATAEGQRLQSIVDAGGALPSVPGLINENGGTTIRKIAVGGENVPLGRYARQWLTQLGLLPAVQSRLIGGEQARQVLDYALRGEVDAAIIYGSDTSKESNRAKLVVVGSHPLPDQVYQAAVMAATAQRKAADSFMAVLTSEQGKAILKDYGFVVVE